MTVIYCDLCGRPTSNEGSKIKLGSGFERDICRNCYKELDIALNTQGWKTPDVGPKV